ncbi:MAG: hypothetical protein E7611_04605 [Ruminococcaceae bacterium]|nr:hypothetical protein [Oscillospiraceae bacterium]
MKSANFYAEDLEMSVDFKSIVGNAELKKRMSRDISDGTLSHAYIIEGPKGSGRHTFAYNVAAALACTSNDSVPCGKCRNCQRIFSGKSPDVITVGLEEDKVTMGVETVREVRDSMVMAPSDFDYKVYVIENTDVMTPQAQNAFLLSLEEPPQYVLFLLLCENSTSLLETVRSRAPSLRLEHLDDAEVEDYVIDHDARATLLETEDEEVFKTIIHAADGRIGRALELLDERPRRALLEERQIAQKILSLFLSPNRAEVLGIASTLGNKRVDVIRYLTVVEYAIRDLIVLKKAENAHLCFYLDKEEAQELSTRFTSVSLMSIYDAISDAILDLEANANVKLTVLNMMQKAGLI